MKLLAFTDIHSSQSAFKRLESKAKKQKPDLIICCGDFTVFEQNVKDVLKKINSLPAPVILIPGNHEDDELIRRICQKYKNITYAHLSILEANGYRIVGHGGGGFYGGRHRDAEFDAFTKATKGKIKSPLILITHAPPYNTKLDYLDWLDEHVGCASYTDFIKKHKPILALSGHLHENFKKTERKGKTLLSNPGQDGTLFELAEKYAKIIRE
ncbi:hypothetical protein D6825_02630 [Candidatus Woesearchaeota archaeon]|nr:MAG: hypothetical protein D6825_02630 [Candidatus Woesearchaeota archaeon]